MNKESIIEHIISATVKRDINLHQNIENFLSSHPQEYFDFLDISLENSLSVGTLMALSTVHTDYTDYKNLLKHPKIQHCIAKDMNFFNDFCLKLSKFYGGNKEDPVFIDTMQQTFDECKKHNNLIIDTSILYDIDHHQDRSNYIIHLFLLSNNHSLTFEDNDNYFNFVDFIFKFDTDFYIKNEDIKPHFAYIFPKAHTKKDSNISKPDFFKIFSITYNIPTATIARTAIILGSVNQKYKASEDFVEEKQLFEIIFEKSPLFKALSGNNNDYIKKEIESYFSTLIRYSDDSYFKIYSQKPDGYNFHSCFGTHLYFMKDILESNKYISRESIKTFFSVAMATYKDPENNLYFESKEFYPFILSEIEKMTISINLLSKETDLKATKKRL